MFQSDTLFIVSRMSELYGAQCALCDLNAVDPLLNLVMSDKKNIVDQFLAAETLRNIAKLRKGRKLIRIKGGVRLLVRARFLPYQSNQIKSTVDILQIIANCFWKFGFFARQTTHTTFDGSTSQN